MFAVEVYAAVQRFVFVIDNNQRDTVRVYGPRPATISKMCQFLFPPCYMRVKPTAKSKLIGWSSRPLAGLVSDRLAVFLSAGEITTTSMTSPPALPAARTYSQTAHEHAKRPKGSALPSPSGF
jgi:hypothetical protein